MFFITESVGCEKLYTYRGSAGGAGGNGRMSWGDNEGASRSAAAEGEGVADGNVGRSMERPRWEYL